MCGAHMGLGMPFVKVQLVLWVGTWRVIARAVKRLVGGCVVNVNRG